MNDQKETSNFLDIGLRELSAEDLEAISFKSYDIAHDCLKKRVTSSKLSSFEIVIDIDNSQDKLLIDIDIIYDKDTNLVGKYEKIIEETLNDTFIEIDKYLKEKFSA